MPRKTTKKPVSTPSPVTVLETVQVTVKTPKVEIQSAAEAVKRNPLTEPEPAPIVENNRLVSKPGPQPAGQPPQDDGKAKPEYGAAYPWLIAAQNELDLFSAESGFPQDRVAQYGDAITPYPNRNAVGWDVAFVGWALNEGGYQSTNSDYGGTYFKFGAALETPTKGAIVVLRDNTNPLRRKTAFYLDGQSNFIRVLMGDVDDAVKIISIPKSEVLAYRYPLWTLNDPKG